MPNQIVVQEIDEKEAYLLIVGGKFPRRRGHRRTLASGKSIWVKQHTVGRKENGSIQKVYDMAA